MPEIKFDLEIPEHLDEPLIDRLPDPNTRVADAREVWIHQVRVQNGLRRQVLPAQERERLCVRSDVAMLTSDARTTDGSWQLDVRSNICFDAESYGEPSITATPIHGKMVLISIGYALSADGRDLTLRVFTDSLDNEPVNAFFHWHAAIPLIGPALI